MARFSKFVVLLSAGMVLGGNAHAGFEFTAPTAAPVKAEINSADESAPMPIFPVEDVTAETLSTPSPAPAPLGEEVYIRRVKPTTAPTPAQDGALVINPYPLDEQAVHSQTGTAPLEQAMMEQGGALRPVAVPGSDNVAGLNARANIISRRDNSANYPMVQKNLAAAQQQKSGLSLTPIPGGEGVPLARVEANPLPPVITSPVASTAPVAVQIPPAVRPVSKSPAMPKPALPEGSLAAAPQPAPNNAPGGYAEAVGFGRDLPLALAMSQVVPPEYSFSFAKDVDVGSTVSWQGGKPWNLVLNDMLATSQMRAVITNNQVMIVSQK